MLARASAFSIHFLLSPSPYSICAPSFHLQYGLAGGDPSLTMCSQVASLPVEVEAEASPSPPDSPRVGPAVHSSALALLREAA